MSDLAIKIINYPDNLARHNAYRKAYDDTKKDREATKKIGTALVVGYPIISSLKAGALTKGTLKTKSKAAGKVATGWGLFLAGGYLAAKLIKKSTEHSDTLQKTKEKAPVISFIASVAAMWTAGNIAIKQGYKASKKSFIKETSQEIKDFIKSPSMKKTMAKFDKHIKKPLEKFLKKNPEEIKKVAKASDWLLPIGIIAYLGKAVSDQTTTNKKAIKNYIDFKNIQLDLAKENLNKKEDK